MSEVELWDHFWKNKIAHAKPFDRDFIWVAEEHFQKVVKFFVREYNVIQQKGSSYRSRGLLSHIHAVVQGDKIFIHKDTGNVARFPPLGLVHLYFDVVPYIIFSYRKDVTFRSIFECPEADSFQGQG